MDHGGNKPAILCCHFPCLCIELKTVTDFFKNARVYLAQCYPRVLRLCIRIIFNLTGGH